MHSGYRFLGIAVLCLAVPMQAAKAQMSAWTPEDSTRLLDPPAAFPQLPSAARRDLQRRGCRIPRASGPDVSASQQARPNNVLAGAFLGPGQHNWAVLCSIADTSRILIYAGARSAHVDSVARIPDGGFLWQERGSARGFYRELGTATPHLIRRLARAAGDHAPPTVDHLGVNDYFAGKASTIYYFRRGRWLEFPGWD
jgi:hypothetical protein